MEEEVYTFLSEDDKKRLVALSNKKSYYVYINHSSLKFGYFEKQLTIGLHTKGKTGFFGQAAFQIYLPMVNKQKKKFSGLISTENHIQSHTKHKQLILLKT